MASYPFKAIAKRRALAEKVVALCRDLKVMANVTTRPLPGRNGADLQVHIMHPRGPALDLRLNFEGQAAQGIFVLSWHRAHSLGKDFLFSPAFNTGAGGHHKATDVCYDADELLECLKDRLTKMNDGRAFLVDTSEPIPSEDMFGLTGAQNQAPLE